VSPLEQVLASARLIAEGSRSEVDFAMLTNAMELLDEEAAAAQHVIVFTDDGWTVLHPLTERLDESIVGCPFRWTGPDPGVRGRFVMAQPDTIDIPSP
jgi:Family of unknown function (DUF6085)